MADVGLVGGKNASLGEMYQQLVPIGVKIPNGFAVTGDAYLQALRDADWRELHRLLDGINKTNKTARQIQAVGETCRQTVYRACVTPEISKQIITAYRELCSQYGDEISVAVRSSATAEDLPNASFAGQHDSFLNVKGEDELIEAYRRCCASLFTDRAISYRIDKEFDHFKVRISVGIMKMVRSDVGCAGVMFTLDTESGYKDAVFLTAAYGLGENVVQGAIDPDEFFVHKPTFRAGHRAVLMRVIGRKQLTMVYNTSKTAKEPVKNVVTPQRRQQVFCLGDSQVLTLADYAIKIEDHYSKIRSRWTPMDIEWALDGTDNELYIVQARPETNHSQQVGSNYLETYTLLGKGKAIVKGRAVGTKISVGRARVITNIKQDLRSFQEGEVLIADTTTPDWEPIMKKAAGIVANRGGRTCHAAIIARELGIPAVIGTEFGTDKIQTGDMITLDCSGGETGTVYDGKVDFKIDRLNLMTLTRPKTKIMVNLGNPELAFKTSQIPNDGVGLARMEFIISEYIKVHPMALIHPDRVREVRERRKVEDIIRNYPDGSAYMVQRLSEGVGTITAAFWPKPVVVRLSDFKSNEYASLIGGKDFEYVEENPMIGFRGASRYAHAAYEEGFALECAAMKRVREEMGLTNLILMVPFCRTIKEGKAVLNTMARHGLVRGVNGLKVYVMCEIPNNVILIDEFAKLFDGFSIGSNDLTQLTLGIDRDNGIVAPSFDERDPGMRVMLRMAVEGCQRNKKHSGICGQGDFANCRCDTFM
ncbi:phosphoenolpyruvate synthase [Gonapodya prolifera JEL478]|uniref:pyruvate, water dikinase n=1 Tax=Gonapodya prolifera (strain JEL478) TaxID=1344416 RepID=A0A139AWF2_GONPJ|nr:phosphoenolpyruvate synthase [Gonapodya prolifera JEL478]|eukprot:KXS21037.1 phosphoenolpyruvate synthase [Gonapodya prolifera JEL478]